MISTVGPIITPDAEGSAGSATSTITKAISYRGVVHAVYVQYNDSPPATTDVTLATAAPTATFLTLTNANTDGWFYPRVNAHDAAGSAEATVFEKVALGQTVTCTIAGADEGDSVSVWLKIEH